MTEFLKNHTLIILMVILIIAMFSYHSYTVRRLSRELYNKQIELIIEKDKLTEEMLNRKSKELDSLVRKEKVKYDSLQLELNKLKRSYEKIRTTYSSVIINRPKF